ncbi:hypothetical protein V8F33_001052 [Rhypophila sp. PSN 637]
MSLSLLPFFLSFLMVLPFFSFLLYPLLSFHLLPFPVLLILPFFNHHTMARDTSMEPPRPNKGMSLILGQLYMAYVILRFWFSSSSHFSSVFHWLVIVLHLVNIQLCYYRVYLRL